MRPLLHAADMPTLRLAHKLLEKAITQAAAALATLDLESEEVSGLSNDARRLLDSMNGNVDRDTWTFDSELVTAAALGLSIQLGKMDKLKSAQIDLLIPVHETVEKADEVRELYDRIMERKLYDRVMGVDSAHVTQRTFEEDDAA